MRELHPHTTDRAPATIRRRLHGDRIGVFMVPSQSNPSTNNDIRKKEDNDMCTSDGRNGIFTFTMADLDLSWP
jgi:hypothetical protein